MAWAPPFSNSARATCSAAAGASRKSRDRWDVAAFCGGPVDHPRRRFDQREEAARYISFAAWHNERCAVCAFRDPRLVRDHDHDRACIPGLLCSSCNGSEPHDRGLFRKYRDRPPAKIPGIHLRCYTARHGWAEPRILVPRRLDNHPAYAYGCKAR
ncbi:endonuclease domain-containing protein [Streptomyces sp. NPDC057398]|uniref:endonuclease domain-containing protein n=1 Tax=unclassified Streptomyces TaxID=2593676 RepID=UPI0036AE7473